MFEYLKEKFEYTDKGQLYGVTFQLTELGKDLVYQEHELTTDTYNEKDYHSIEKVWDEMFEYFQGHGWDYIPMWAYESLGYLTENPYIITDNCRDVFYFDSYQIKSVMYDIVFNGKVFFNAMHYSNEELQSVFEIIENGW